MSMGVTSWSGGTRFYPSPRRQRRLYGLCIAATARRHHLGDIAAEGGDLLDQARAQVGVLERGHEEDGVDLRRELAVGVRHLELGLEVAHGAQAADDEAGAELAREVDRQAVEASTSTRGRERRQRPRRWPRG